MDASWGAPDTRPLIQIKFEASFRPFPINIYWRQRPIINLGAAHRSSGWRGAAALGIQRLVQWGNWTLPNVGTHRGTPVQPRRPGDQLRSEFTVLLGIQTLGEMPAAWDG